MPLQQASFRAMGSPCELRLYCKDQRSFDKALDICRTEVERLEAKYSRYRDSSLLSQINQSAGKHGLELDQETSALLDYVDQVYAQSGGLFDPTAGTLSKVWDFKKAKKPSNRDLEPLLKQVGWSRLQWHKPKLQIPRGMQLDFGGFVKEYAVDSVATKLQQAGFQAGVVDLGGDLMVLGPHPDGRPWQIGLRNPRSPDTAMMRLGVLQGAVASSGDYERYFILDGVRYCHILNPKTGQPTNGIAGVSVIAPQCLIAGTACTVAMLQGPSAGRAWLNELGLDYLMALSDGSLHRHLPSDANTAPKLTSGC